MLQVVTINFLVFGRLKRLSHWGDFWNSFHLLSFFLEMFFENHVLCTLVVLRGGWTCLAVLGCAWAYLGVVLLHLVLHSFAWFCIGAVGHTGRCWSVLGQGFAFICPKKENQQKSCLSYISSYIWGNILFKLHLKFLYSFEKVFFLLFAKSYDQLLPDL